MQQIYIVLIKRFARAFVAGAIGNMVLVMGFSGNSWREVSIWLAALAMSGIVGGITGLLMGLDKYFRS